MPITNSTHVQNHTSGIIPCMDVTEIIRIITQPGKTIPELINDLGYSGPLTIKGKLLNWLVAVCPEYSVIYDILYYNPDICEPQPVRESGFAEAVRKRDGACWITGRYGKRCEAAHIYEYKDCKDSGDRYNINNGILLDAGLHKLWDMGEIVFVPIDKSSAAFQINPDSGATHEDVPELATPITFTNIGSEMMKFIQKRYELFNS